MLDPDSRGGGILALHAGTRLQRRPREAAHVPTTKLGGANSLSSAPHVLRKQLEQLDGVGGCWPVLLPIPDWLEGLRVIIMHLRQVECGEQSAVDFGDVVRVDGPEPEKGARP